MSRKSRLSLAALLSLVALGATAATNANAFQPKPTRFCQEGIFFQSCGVYWTNQEPARYHAPPRHGDTSPAYMKALDSRDNQAMSYAGGGGGGGGSGGGGGR